MKKDAFYFSHDSNAKDDPKCVMLIEQLGLEGYGIFWVLIETLRDQKDYKYPLVLIPALARRYNTTTEKMKTVVMNYKLFQFDDEEFFFSDSLLRRMKLREGQRKALSEAGKRGNAVRWGDSSPGDRKERKGKEKKRKEIYNNNIIDLFNWSKSYFEEKYLNEKWKDCIRLLLYNDQYSELQVKNSIIIAKRDEFWKNQFISPLKLRGKDRYGVKYIDKFLALLTNGQSIKNKPGHERKSSYD